MEPAGERGEGEAGHMTTTETATAQMVVQVNTLLADEGSTLARASDGSFKLTLPCGEVVGDVDPADLLAFIIGVSPAAGRPS